MSPGQEHHHLETQEKQVVSSFYPNMSVKENVSFSMFPAGFVHSWTVSVVW